MFWYILIILCYGLSWVFFNRVSSLDRNFDHWEDSNNPNHAWSRSRKGRTKIYTIVFFIPIINFLLSGILYFTILVQTDKLNLFENE